MTRLIKFWNDPVWSKVIAAGIIALIALGYSVINKIPYWDVLKNVALYSVKLWIIAVALIAYFILNGLFKLFRSNPVLERQNELKQMNSFEDKQEGILWRWIVYFRNGKPEIFDLKPYCTIHPGAPIRFIGNTCPVPDCKNNRYYVDTNIAQNHFESELIDRWETMK